MKVLYLYLISFLLLGILACGRTSDLSKTTIISPQDLLLGQWVLIEYEDTESLNFNDTIIFEKNNKYQRKLNESGNWEYNYVNLDSLIIYNKGFGEQHYKIIALTQDSLILQFKENVIYGDSNHKAIFNDVEKYIRANK